MWINIFLYFDVFVQFIETTERYPDVVFIEMFEIFCVERDFYSFNNVIYKQSFGTPMGSPLSPVIADLVMRRLQTVSLMSLDLDVVLYFRYVDDICTVVVSSKIDLLLEQFNLFHPRLQFISEVGGDEINFLDVTISINENGFGFDWYRKPTFSGRFLNFNSNHPMSQKRDNSFTD